MKIKIQNSFYSIFLVCLTGLFISCNNTNTGATEVDELSDEERVVENEGLFMNTIQSHLDAVNNKDLMVLNNTLSSEGNMQLVLPNGETVKSARAYIKYYRELFKNSNWTFKYKIINANIEQRVGIAITEIVFQGLDKDGKPLNNKMVVSYALKRVNGVWFITKNHASSIEKSIT